MRGVQGPSEPFSFFGSPLGMGVLLAATGFFTWVAISAWIGMTSEPGFALREAWDVPAYYYLGVPVMAAAVAIAAFMRPSRPWRWPLWLVGGHQAGVMVMGLGMQSAASVLILTVVLAVLLAAGFAIPAMIGAMAARALTQRAV